MQPRVFLFDFGAKAPFSQKSIPWRHSLCSGNLLHVQPRVFLFDFGAKAPFSQKSIPWPHSLCSGKSRGVHVTIGNPAFLPLLIVDWPTFSRQVTGAHWWRHEQKIKYWPIRTREIGGVTLSAHGHKKRKDFPFLMTMVRPTKCQGIEGKFHWKLTLIFTRRIFQISVVSNVVLSASFCYKTKVGILTVPNY